MANKFLQLQRKLLDSVQKIREESDDLCDVTFAVGKNEEDRREIRANSTILALRSPYFRAMCFGPMRNPDSVKIIPDMHPDTFEKVLDFVHAKDDAMDLSSAEEAWSLRYAASQFLISDLIEICEDFLHSALNFKNALRLLHQAALFKADDFKRKIYRVIKNRHSYILNSPDLALLELAELIEVIKLYKHVKTDLIIKAIHIWSKNLDDDTDFKDIFRTKLFKHIKWDNLSNENMLELHDLKMLPLELENEAMVSILARSKPLPQEESKTVCSLDLQIKPGSGVPQGSSSGQVVKRVFLRTLRSYQRSLSSIWSRKDVSLVLDHDGMTILKDVLKIKPLQGIELDSEDLELKYSVNHSSLQRAENLRAINYHIRHDNKDFFFFELNFDDILLGCSSPEMSKNVDNLFLEVSIAPEVLKDLMDFNLQSSTVLTRIDKVSSDALEVQKKSWQTWIDGKQALSSDDSTPKYFFDGCGIPVFSQIN